jgi:PST family polysaccharide transporter
MWAGGGSLVRQLVQIVTLLIMVRFLSPTDYGIYAIAMVFIAFLQVFGSMGTAQVIVHLPDPDDRMLSTIFFFNQILGTSLFLILFFSARPIAQFFGNPELITILRIMGVIFIISSLGVVHRALLEKSMLFKGVVGIETIALVTASAAGIISAISGLGVYSLLVQSILNWGISSLGFWVILNWRPKIMFHMADIRKIWSYTANLTSFSIVNYFARNADNFLIGKFIGSSGLGVYNVAYQIMLYPLTNISHTFVRVLFPAFSQVQDDNERFKRGYLSSITFIALVTFPMMAGLFAVSDFFVAVAFGDKWAGLSVLVMILAPIGMIQSIVTTLGSVYTAKGTTGLMLKIGAANAAVTVLSFVIGLPYGVKGVAICYGIANLIMLYPNLKTCWNQIDLGVLEGSRKLSPFFLSSVFMGGAVFLQGHVMSSGKLTPLAALAIQVITGVILYLVLIFLFKGKLVRTLISELQINKQDKQAAK